MKYKFYYKSDIGTARPSNQDCAYAKCLKTRIGESFMGIVCDGMGGLSSGEIASQTVVGIFSDWFDNEFRYILSGDGLFPNICCQWSGLIKSAHKQLTAYITNSGSELGTTLSVLLIVNGCYYAAQIGDSRIYMCRDNLAQQVTNDHSYVADLARNGLITFDEASVSTEKNVLTRCIGSMDEFAPDFYTGEVCGGDFFLISSDGFHGGIVAREMSVIVENINSSDIKEVKNRLERRIEQKKQHGERDNITALCVKVV